MILETERLVLREMDDGDFDALYAIFSDPETMAHYPAPFGEAKVRDWIAWNKQNYADLGFGLWAVVLKETGEVIGDCGVTMQRIDGRIRPEIGYHIAKRHQRKGYASEAARRCRDFIFENTPFGALYSYMKYTNVGSYSTAESIGLRKLGEYPDDVNGVTCFYAITRSEWEKLRSEGC